METSNIQRRYKDKKNHFPCWWIFNVDTHCRSSFLLFLSDFFTISLHFALFSFCKLSPDWQSKQMKTLVTQSNPNIRLMKTQFKLRFLFKINIWTFIFIFHKRNTDCLKGTELTRIERSLQWNGLGVKKYCISTVSTKRRNINRNATHSCRQRN